MSYPGARGSGSARDTIHEYDSFDQEPDSTGYTRGDHDY